MRRILARINAWLDHDEAAELARRSAAADRDIELAAMAANHDRTRGPQGPHVRDDAWFSFATGWGDKR